MFSRVTRQFRKCRLFSNFRSNCGQKLTRQSKYSTKCGYCIAENDTNPGYHRVRSTISRWSAKTLETTTMNGKILNERLQLISKVCCFEHCKNIHVICGVKHCLEYLSIDVLTYIYGDWMSSRSFLHFTWRCVFFLLDWMELQPLNLLVILNCLQ